MSSQTPAREELTGTSREIEDLIRARYILIYVVSAEEKRVEDALLKVGNNRKRKVLAWSCTEGLEAVDGTESFQDIRDPLRALEFIAKYEDDAIFVLRDFHPYLKDPTVTRRLRDLNRDFKRGSNYKRNIVLLSGILNVPMEIEKDLAVVDFELPDRDDIEHIVDKMMTSLSHLPMDARTDPQKKRRVVEGALGLTAEEAENVFSKSIIRCKDFDLDVIVNEKKTIIRKSGILEFYETHMDMSSVGGLDVLKDWFQKRSRAFEDDARAFGLPMPKGLLLLGIPGCGKSLTAKALGHQWQVPLLRLEALRMKDGVANVTEADVSKSLLHYHFDSKEHLFMDAQLLMCEDLFAQVQGVRRGAIQSVEQFRLALIKAVEHIEGQRESISVLLEFRTLALDNPAIGDQMATFNAQVLELIEEAIRDTLGPLVDRLVVPPDRFARILCTFFHGLLVDFSLARTEQDRMRVRDTFSDVESLLFRTIVSDSHFVATAGGAS